MCTHKKGASSKGQGLKVVKSKVVAKKWLVGMYMQWRSQNFTQAQAEHTSMEAKIAHRNGANTFNRSPSHSGLCTKIVGNCITVPS